LALACGAGVPQTIQAPELNDRNRALYARTNLEKARALRMEERHEVAESVARRGLTFEPDNTELLRLRADLLERLGRADEARVLRAQADELAPPRPALDDLPHPLSAPTTKLLVVLLPPAPSLLSSARPAAPRLAAWRRGRHPCPAAARAAPQRTSRHRARSPALDRTLRGHGQGLA
jgi:tetratricopeptide (TPR) repeat protein